MPRNGSGVYSLPPGSTFTPNTLIQSSVVNGINNDIATDMNTPRPIVAGGTGSASKNFDDLVVYALKTTNYTAVLADNNATHRFAATATLALTAAATLGTGWHYTVIADGADITIDPNASETIGGQLTWVVPNGASATIVCNGTSFFFATQPCAWQFIGKYTLSAVSSLNITNLSAFKTLRARGMISISTAAALYLRTSTDNGVTWDQGGTDYTYQTLTGSNASATAAVASLTAVPIASQNVLTVAFETTIENFNVASSAFFRSNIYSTSATTLFSEQNIGSRNSATARNGVQILNNGAGTNTGYVILEGIRG